MIFSMGDGTGVFGIKGIEFGGRFDFKIKDHIDRKFANRFQNI
jgi:hypothetical protein